MLYLSCHLVMTTNSATFTVSYKLEEMSDGMDHEVTCSCCLQKQTAAARKLLKRIKATALLINYPSTNFKQTGWRDVRPN